MVERWLEAHIFFTNELIKNVQQILSNIIQYCADQLESKQMRKTFHYLFEPRIDGQEGIEILFRIEVRNNTSLKDVEKLISNRLSQLEHLIDGNKIIRDYQGEAIGFGEDGWELTKQMFEIGSKIAIGQTDAGFKKGEKFGQGKLIHCFLNQQMINEAEFHADALVSRILVKLRSRSVTRDVETNIRNLIEATLNKWKSSKITSQ